MGGWPDFVVVSNSGQTLRTQTQHVRQNAPPEPVWTTIDLKPGAKASFDVYNSDSNPVAGTACPDTSPHGSRRRARDATSPFGSKSPIAMPS